MTRKRSLSAWLIVAMTVALFMLFVGMSHTASAAVGGGGTGGGGGGGSGPYTWNGFGWYKFGINDAGPADFKNGNTWANVQQICRGENADYVLTYLILRSTGGVNNARVYTDDSSDSEGWTGFMGNSGGNWMTRAGSSALFGTLPSSQTAGYAVGSNVGWYCYSDRTRWSVRAESYIKKVGTSAPAGSSTGYGQTDITATPGDTLNFAHDLRAQDADIDKTVYYTIRGSGLSDSFRMIGQSWSGSTTILHGTVSPRIPNNSLFVRFGNMPSYNASYMSYSVSQDDVGNNLCQRIEWAPARWDNGNSGATQYRCAYVPYNYSITPNVTPSIEGIVEPGATFDVTPRVNNPTGPTKTQNTQWQLTQMIVNPGTSVPHLTDAGASTEQPCGTYFKQGTVARCSTLSSGTSVFGIGQNASVLTGSALASAAVTADSLAVGTKICFAFSVQPRAASIPANPSEDNKWQHSTPICLIVGKKPKIQIHGGDLMVGRAFPGATYAASSSVDASTTNKLINGSAQSFGSWVEYGVFASGSISGIGSASGFSGADPMVNKNRLTFGNCVKASMATPTCSPILGNHTFSQPTIPDVAKTLTAITADETHSISSNITAGLGQGVYRFNVASGNLTIDAATIAKGQSIIINAPNSAVTINGNLQYSSEPLTNANDIPQLVIIADRIKINESVTRVDAWLIANGVNGIIDTCAISDSYTTPILTSLICRDQLTVNGPVMSKKLWLRRTAGSEGATVESSAAPGEVFNLRPDAYIWATAHSAANSKITTIYTNELPPRF